MRSIANRWRWLAVALMVCGVAILGRAGFAADPAKPEWKPPRPNAVTYFRGFLGVYAQRTEFIPFVFLHVPNKNLWTKEIQDQLRGHTSLPLTRYFGTAQIAIPVDGVYTLTLAYGKMSINGRDTDGSGELRMVKGIHRVEFASGNAENGGIGSATVSLKNKDTGEEVEFFNSWKDIQQFLKTPIQGQKVTDVTEWKPTAEDELKVDLKKFKVDKANP